MLIRVEISGTKRITYTQEWTVENRLAVVTNTISGDVTRFVYDGACSETGTAAASCAKTQPA